MNKICLIADLCGVNVQSFITEDIADNLLAFSDANIDVQFLCLPSQYQHVKSTLVDTKASDAFVSVVSSPTPPAKSELKSALSKHVRARHTHAFYCLPQTIADDDIISIVDAKFSEKLKSYVGNKLVDFSGGDCFFGGALDALSGDLYVKTYNPKDKAKNNVKSLFKKIKTGK